MFLIVIAMAREPIATYSLTMLSIIIPTLQAENTLDATLTALEASEMGAQMIISDGGSTDATCEIAGNFGAEIVDAPRGRGSQLAAGAKAATQPWLLFLHADTKLGKAWQIEVQNFIKAESEPHCAAVFKFALDDPSPAARRLEKIVAWRCRWFGLPYGDQGLLISREHYDEIGGYAGLLLFEDVDIIRRIGRRHIRYLDTPATTSADRYKKSGYVLRPIRNATCLSLYFAGLPPNLIGRLYQ
jgi:rSAM/selenodomain-associated transferase 2